MSDNAYLGNPNLKKVNTPVESLYASPPPPDAVALAPTLKAVSANKLGLLLRLL